MANNMRYKYTALLRAGEGIVERTFYSNTCWVEDGVIKFGEEDGGQWFRMIGVKNLIDLIETDLQKETSNENEHSALKDEHPTVLPQEHK